MSRSKKMKKFGLLASLYFSQGIPHGLFFMALPVILREWGVSLEVIGGLAGFSAFWAVKFMSAPYIDQYHSARLGKRRGWIIPLQMVTALCVFSMLFWSSGSLNYLILALICLMNLTTSTQDIAADGLAVDLLEPHEWGWGNGIQVGAYSLGYILGGGAVLMAYPSLGMGLVSIVLGSMLILALVPVLLFKEPPARSLEMAKPKISHFFKREGIVGLMVMLALFRMGSTFHQRIAITLLVDLGFEGSNVGIIVTLGSLAIFLGAVVGGLFANRLGAKKALIIYGLVRVLILLVYCFFLYFEMKSQVVYTVIYMLDNIVYALINVSLLAHMMHWSQKSQAATDYTLQDSVGVLGMLTAMILGGVIAGQFGYLAAFSSGLAVSIIGLLAVFLLFNVPAVDREEQGVL